ncbi:MAG: Ig-like domain-containing protein, partial [Pseudomonadota bacterium]|nr:Ig-like domain-containing protein [Pseudomonadota bacterium]
MPDHGLEARQLREAEQSLVNNLRALQSAPASAARMAQTITAYHQWNAAVLLIQAQQKTIAQRLHDKSAGSAYLSRHQDVVQNLKSRFDQIHQLLEPIQGITQGTATINVANLGAALALLEPRSSHAAREPILKASGLPVGSVNLGTRAAKITPAITPTYATASESPTAPDDIGDSLEAPLSQEIIARAKSLDNDYVRIYEFVRNNTRTEWYAGSVKGALGTLRSAAGNDVDQASLLLALLRATGVPARYVHGVIELPVETVANSLALKDSAQVPNALTNAGIAFTPIPHGGRLAAVQVEHSWISALVQYTNYRGAVVDASGKTWIPLDPSFKDIQLVAPTAVLSSIATSAGLMDEYLAQASTQPFAEALKKRVTDALQARTGSAVDYAAALGSQTIKPLTLSLLPNSLPYPVIAVTSESASIGVGEQVRVHLVVHTGAAATTPVALDATFPLAEITNQRFTLSYLPATLEDHRLALLFGGMDTVPLYLIQLRPQVSIGGKARAIGQLPVSPGADLAIELDIVGPFGTQHFGQTVMAGAYHALAVAGSSLSRPDASAAEDTESMAAKLLDGIAVNYTRQWLDGEAQIAALTGVTALRPMPSVSFVSNQLATESVGEVPYSLAWKGVSLDAIGHPVEPLGANAKDFMLLSGLHGSSLEFSVFETQFSGNSISADKGLALAKSAGGVGLLQITSANVTSIDPTDHAMAVKDHIRNLARLGYRVDVPAARISYKAWTGSVWRAIDPVSGASGYFISGGLAGGSTSDAPGTWVLKFLEDALRAQNSDGGNHDPLAGSTIDKMGATDQQKGTVGQNLARPLTVKVLDRDGLPVIGAKVTFQVSSGGGTFAAGAPSIDVLTDSLGLASAPFTLGKKTASDPLYVLLNPADQSATRVGRNIVEAFVTTEKGPHGIARPFTAIGQPDVLSQLTQKSAAVSTGPAATWDDALSMATSDQFDNPLANVPVRFAIATTMVCQSDKAAQYFKQGAVFDNSVKPDGTTSCPVAAPKLGDCGAATLNKNTGADGTASAGVILGNDVMGVNTVTVLAGTFSKTLTYTASGYCSSPRDPMPYNAYLLGAGELIDGQGNNISAAKVAELYKRPMSATVSRDVYPYE